jgi:hypothetical protein
MTIANIPSINLSEINELDLVQPDRVVNSASDAGNRLPRPMPEISDTGRISFGASCRILRSGM